MKGYRQAYIEKYLMAIATNLASFCCVLKEKIVKYDLYF